MGKLGRVAAFMSAFLMVLGVLAGCTASSSGGSGNKNLVIATELPVAGTSASIGLPTQYGVDLAVEQNKDLGNGYTLTVKHDNYQGASGADNGLATTNVTNLVADSSVVAAVGPFNSGVAVVTIPISNQGGLTFISPANTNPGLTLQEYAADNGINFSQLHPAGKPDAYFRIPGTDVVQGKVDAQIIAAAPINAKNVFEIDDKTVYGVGLTNFFDTNFKASGGTVINRISFTSGDVSKANTIADTIKAANPDAVFFGGTTDSQVGALKKALVAKGFDVPWVGGDGIADDSAWLETAGAGAPKTYGTVAAPDTSTLTSDAAKKFVTDYTTYVAGKQNNDLIPYSAMAYDAAMIEITAIKSVIQSGKEPTRENVRAAVAATNYAGITGQISFDQNGDNAGPKVFAVYSVDATGKWVFSNQVNG